MTYLFIAFCVVMALSFGGGCFGIGTLIPSISASRKWIMIHGATALGSLIVLGFALFTYVSDQSAWARIAGMDYVVAQVRQYHFQACRIDIPVDTMKRLVNQ